MAIFSGYVESAMDDWSDNNGTLQYGETFVQASYLDFGSPTYSTAYFDIDTSDLPDNITVTAVTFYVYSNSVASSGTGPFTVRFHVNDVECHDEVVGDIGQSQYQSFEFSSACYDEINTTGKTRVKITADVLASFSVTSWSMAAYDYGSSGGTRAGYLVIEYDEEEQTQFSYTGTVVQGSDDYDTNSGINTTLQASMHYPLFDPVESIAEAYVNTDVSGNTILSGTLHFYSHSFASNRGTTHAGKCSIMYGGNAYEILSFSESAYAAGWKSVDIPSNYIQYLNNEGKTRFRWRVDSVTAGNNRYWYIRAYEYSGDFSAYVVLTYEVEGKRKQRIFYFG